MSKTDVRRYFLMFLYNSGATYRKVGKYIVTAESTGQLDFIMQFLKMLLVNKLA